MDQTTTSTPDIDSGANWAKGFGIAKMVLGVLLMFLLSGMDETLAPMLRFTALDGLIQVGIGAVSLFLGLKLSNAATRKSSQFTTLIWIYGIAIALNVIAFMSMSADGAQPTGQIVPILTAWALWKFIKGRRELRNVEISLRAQSAA